MKIPKWLWLVIALSLALNLALIGFVAGKATAGGYPIDPARMFPRWARSLPEERFEELRPMLREHMRGQFPQMRKLKRHHPQLQAAITAQPYDPDALEQALSEWRQDIARTQAASDSALVKFVGQLSVEERRQFAAQMLRPRHAGRPKHRPAHRPGFGPEHPSEPGEPSRQPEMDHQPPL